MNKPQNHSAKSNSNPRANNQGTQNNKSGNQQRNGNPNRGKSSMSADAPYNFVPVSDKVLFAEQRIKQDAPIQQGLSGTIDISVTLLEPLTIGDERKAGNKHEPGFVSCFTLPKALSDKPIYAIPGTSVKGMVRSLYEILTYSKMNQVEDKRFGVRDLQFEHYKGRFTKRQKHTDGKDIYFSKVKTGWLKFENRNWQFSPCDHWRIEQDALSRMSSLFKENKLSSWKEMKKMPASKKYEMFKELAVTFKPTQAEHHMHNKKYMHYAKLDRLNNIDQAEQTRGFLVLTGQPQDRKGKTSGVKHMEFVFSQPDFSNALSDDNIQQKVAQFKQTYKETDEFKGLNKIVSSGRLPAIPVFYLEEGNQIHSFGLSQLYKLAADYSIHDTIKSISSQHFSNKQDWTENLFGFINEDGKDKTQSAQKGRVSFGLLTSSNATAAETGRTVLMGPKATFYPYYLKQPKAKSDKTIDKQNWVAYLKPVSQNASAPQLRGRKFYPVKTFQSAPIPPTSITSEKTVVQLEYLKKGANFKGKIRLHNLSTLELGALVWALTLEGSASRHQLGMAKSFGFGQVTIKLKNPQLIPNGLTDEFQPLETYKKAFEQYMENQIPGWRNSESIESLLAMLNLEKVQAYTNAHRMRLKHLPEPKLYANLKGDKGSVKRPRIDGLLLPPILARQNVSHAKKDHSNISQTVYKEETIKNNPFDQLKK